MQVLSARSQILRVNCWIGCTLEKSHGYWRVQPAKTQTEVRRIIGLFGYFRDHSPNYAAIARPLTDLTTKRVPNKLPWTDVHTSVLNQLKQALCEALKRQLSVADFSKPFNIRVDANDTTVAVTWVSLMMTVSSVPLRFYRAAWNADAV